MAVLIVRRLAASYESNTVTSTISSTPQTRPRLPGVTRGAVEGATSSRSRCLEIDEGGTSVPHDLVPHGMKPWRTREVEVRVLGAVLGGLGIVGLAEEIADDERFVRQRGNLSAWFPIAVVVVAISST